MFRVPGYRLLRCTKSVGEKSDGAVSLELVNQRTLHTMSGVTVFVFVCVCLCACVCVVFVPVCVCVCVCVCVSQ